MARHSAFFSLAYSCLLLISQVAAFSTVPARRAGAILSFSPKRCASTKSNVPSGSRLLRLDMVGVQVVADTPPPSSGDGFTESRLRSAVKAFSWRIVACAVTFMTTLRFSGSLSTAIKLIAADFLPKGMIKFAGERLMNKSQAGRSGGCESASRSLAKALIWRFFSVGNTLLLAVLVSKDFSIASKIASTDAVFKTSLMFLYERAWARVEWGVDRFHQGVGFATPLPPHGGKTTVG